LARFLNFSCEKDEEQLDFFLNVLAIYFLPVSIYAQKTITNTVRTFIAVLISPGARRGGIRTLDAAIFTWLCKLSTSGAGLQ
jgi:hypothetical protein